MKKNKISKKGFTLMEMLIVVTIIGILAAIVLPRFITSASSGRKAAHRQMRTTINSQLETFYFINDVYPAAMTNEAWSVGDANYLYYFPEGVPTTCNAGGALTLNNGRIDNSSHSGHE
jgi:general secretion pathway protein G